MAAVDNSSPIDAFAGATNRSGLGIEAFDILRAEAEPWLAQVFETPPEFDLFSGPRSCVIFGESGAGKSAVYQALIKLAQTASSTQKRLVAMWRPGLAPDEHELDNPPVDHLVADIFDACAFSTIRHLMQTPALFEDAPEWAQAIIHWFVHQYLRNDVALRAKALQREANEQGIVLFSQLMAEPKRNLFADDAAPELIIAQLVNALAEVKVQGVWVLVDRLGAAEGADIAHLAAGLRGFLSSLNLFEQEGFVYKILLPIDFRVYLTNVSGIERRRLSLHYLDWTREKLAALLMKRMSLAVGQTLQRLDEICTDDLAGWLERCGGMTPRGWLEQFRPLAAAYLDRQRSGQTGPISIQEWRAIRRRHPPLLTFDREQRLVRVGERVVELTEEQFKIFRYLYDHAGQVCTRSELYYRAYQALDYEPRVVSDNGYEAPADYRTLIETAIWRLRRSIEPDDKDETFIITVKGKGYRLEHA